MLADVCSCYGQSQGEQEARGRVFSLEDMGIPAAPLCPSHTSVTDRVSGRYSVPAESWRCVYAVG